MNVREASPLVAPHVERSTSRRPLRPLRGAGRILLHPATNTGLVLLVFFGYLIVAPVVSLLLSAVRVGHGEEAQTGRPVGAFTLHHLQRVLASDISPIIFVEPLLHTTVLAVAAIVGALLIGLPIAWLLARTDLPARRWFSTALVVPYMLPAWTFAFAWTTVFKNRRMGGAPGWLEAAGITPPDAVAYGALPITVVFVLHFTPFVILLGTAAMRRLPDEHDDAARVLGAGPGIRMRRIVLPLLRPAVVSAATLIFAKVLGEFGVAYVLGTPVDFGVLSTTLYQSISTRQAGTAAVIAAAMVVLGALSVWIDVRLLRTMQRYVTVGGRTSAARVRPLGRARPLALAAVVSLFTVSVVVPLGVLLLSTLMREPGRFALSNLTLDFWIGSDLPTVGFSDGVLRASATWQAALHTLSIVGLAAIGSGILGLLVGYAAVRSPVRPLGTALRAITFSPYLVPGIAFAVAILSLFAVQRGPVPALYGTTLILVLAMLADEMPFASRAGVSGMMQLGREPEEAAQMLGAGWLRRMARIVLPLQRTTLANAIILPFISGVQSLSLVVVLATPGTELLTTLSMTMIDRGYTHAANAIVLLICLLALTGTLLAQRFLRADLAQGGVA